MFKNFKLNESNISTILGGLVIAVVGILVFNYFRNLKISQPAAPAGTEKTESEVSKETLSGELNFEVPTKETHKVVKGENLWKIAEKYYGSGYNWMDIAKANNLKNPGLLFADQELKIPDVAKREPVAKGAIASGVKVQIGEPISGDKYTVVKGDNLWNIAVRAYGDGFQWPKIAKANSLANPNLIHSGNTFVIPR